MQKTVLFILLANLVVCSCTESRIQDEIAVDSNVRVLKSFIAFSANSSWGTKTVLQEDGAIFWNPGDSINLFHGSVGGTKFVSTNKTASPSAEFVGLLDIGTFANDSSYWGIYPYSKDNTCNGRQITLTVPSRQNAVANTYAPEAFPSVAKSSGQELRFENVCGGVKFQIQENDIKKVVFTGNGGEMLTGKMFVSDREDKPMIDSIRNGSSSITLATRNGSSLESGKWYYIASSPVDLSKGYTMEFFKDAQYGRLSSSNAVSVKRSTWSKISTVAMSSVKFGYYPLIIDATSDSEINNVISIGGTKILSLDYGAGHYYWTPADKLTSIDKSFFAMTSITGIIIPESVIRISDSAFEGCSALSSVSIPGGVSYIGLRTFGSCTSLKKVYIANGVSAIGISSFNGCTALQELTIPGSVKSIAEYAFNICVSLSKLTLEYGLEEIKSQAFSSCYGLKSLTIPGSVKTIGTKAFEECSNLSIISLEEGINTISSQAFVLCAFKTITIPKSVTSLGAYLFYGCKDLTEATILAEVPPTCTLPIFPNSIQHIYVPSKSVDAYKAATGWSVFADKIQAIPAS